jgi:hypothetical protein
MLGDVMPVETQILQENDVVLYKFSDPLDLAEFGNLTLEQRPHIYDRATKPVNVIVDSTEVTKIPTHTMYLLLQGDEIRHPMGGSVVVVNNGIFGNLFALAVSKLFAGKISFVETMEEALQVTHV